MLASCHEIGFGASNRIVTPLGVKYPFRKPNYIGGSDSIVFEQARQLYCKETTTVIPHPVKKRDAG